MYRGVYEAVLLGFLGCGCVAERLMLGASVCNWGTLSRVTESHFLGIFVLFIEFGALDLIQTEMKFRRLVITWETLQGWM